MLFAAFSIFSPYRNNHLCACTLQDSRQYIPNGKELFIRYINIYKMNTDINHYIIRSNQKAWTPLVEGGIHYPGVSVKSLRFDEAQGRSTTILLAFEPGASYPYHNHPAGEELFVLQGEAIIENQTLGQGDYLYTPPGFKHAVRSEAGCILLLVVPEEVEIL